MAATFGPACLLPIWIQFVPRQNSIRVQNESCFEVRDSFEGGFSIEEVGVR
jgi:hypothetical protein